MKGVRLPITGWGRMKPRVGLKSGSRSQVRSRVWGRLISESRSRVEARSMVDMGVVIGRHAASPFQR